MESMKNQNGTGSRSAEKLITMRVRTLRDRTQYFVGLLLLISSDGRISQPEREKLMEIADLLDFAPEYCKEVMDNVLQNKYIEKNPVRFSSIETARAFIEDGIRLASADDELTSGEDDWLKSVASINDIPLDWLELVKKSVMKKKILKSWSVTKWWPGDPGSDAL